MKFTKSFISLILILTLTLSLFSLAACGGDKADKTSSDKAIGSSASTPQNDVKEESESQPETVVVPNVVGMNVDEATKVLGDLGLVVETEVKHLVYKDTNNTSLGYCDDKCVLEQDSKAGTVMIEGSTLKLTYNSNTSQFDYTVNEDGTITINNFKRIKKDENKSIYIPAEYNGYQVSHIEAAVFERLLPYATTSNYRIFVPIGVSIDNPTNTPIELY